MQGNEPTVLNIVLSEFMFQVSTHYERGSRRFGIAKLGTLVVAAILNLPTAGALAGNAGELPVRGSIASGGVKFSHYVTNVAQFRTLSGEAFATGCDFQITGVVTLVDTNRDLVVLQDKTGAAALNFPVEDQRLQVGRLVTLDGANCCPYFAEFPAYPYRPSD